MRISFLWYFDKASQISERWRDGLRSALEIIGKKHEVDWYLDKKVPEDEYDFILLWDDSNSEFFNQLDNYHARKGLCLTTDPRNFDNLRKLDVVFCESDPIYEAVRREGIRAIKAFGTDTEFFKPAPRRIKTIDYFYPATFSPWKRQSEIAYLGKQLTCVGTVQPDGVQELAECTRNGVRVENGYFPVRKIRDYYQRSSAVIIPAVHGSERTVLEAMSCGIKPIVTHPENVRTYSYLKELDASGLSPREFVVKNYSHFKYATDLLRGIEND
jgi:glycosyltransferase involved in cell wall biosynthesis